MCKDLEVTERGVPLYEALLGKLRAFWYGWCTDFQGGGIVLWKIKLISEERRSQITKCYSSCQGIEAYEGSVELFRDFKLGYIMRSDLHFWTMTLAACVEWIGKSKAGNRESHPIIFPVSVAMSSWRSLLNECACCSSSVGWKINLHDYAEGKYGNTFID